MKSVKHFAFTAVLLGAVVATSSAVVQVQKFQFQNPLGSSPTTDTNATFVTEGLSSLSSPVAGSFQNILGTGQSTTQSVKLLTYNTDQNNVTAPAIETTGVSYFIKAYATAPLVYTPLGYADNDTFGGLADTNGNIPTGSGLITFVKNSVIVLQLSFEDAILSNGSFANTVNPTQVHLLGGNLVQSSVLPSNNDFYSFGFTTDPNDENYRSSGFNSSFGKVTPVPEPSSVAALALGGLALLRRKRRA